MLQNAISGVKRRARLCLEQNGEHFQHYLVTLFNKINITIVIFLLIPRILNVAIFCFTIVFKCDVCRDSYNKKLNGSHDTCYMGFKIILFNNKATFRMRLLSTHKLSTYIFSVLYFIYIVYLLSSTNIFYIFDNNLLND
jgi:hypothetical protein